MKKIATVFFLFSVLYGQGQIKEKEQEPPELESAIKQGTAQRRIAIFKHHLRKCFDANDCNYSNLSNTTDPQKLIEMLTKFSKTVDFSGMRVYFASTPGFTSSDEENNKQYNLPEKGKIFLIFAPTFWKDTADYYYNGSYKNSRHHSVAGMYYAISNTNAGPIKLPDFLASACIDNFDSNQLKTMKRYTRKHGFGTGGNHEGFYETESIWYDRAFITGNNGLINFLTKSNFKSVVYHFACYGGRGIVRLFRKAYARKLTLIEEFVPKDPQAKPLFQRIRAKEEKTPPRSGYGDTSVPCYPASCDVSSLEDQ